MQPQTYLIAVHIVLTLTPTMNSSQMVPGESVIFQPVLQAYPTRHSWIITTHISLGNLEHHWKLFNQQLTKTQQFLRSLDQHPSTPTQLLSTLHLELSNIQDIYNSGESTVTYCNKIVTFQPTTDSYTPQKKFTTFSWRCPQLPDWNSYHKGHPQHQNMYKPTYCHPDITEWHPGTYCIYLECHKVCHTD